MTPIRTMIVDDHAILRMGLKSLLSDKKDIELVGEASNGDEAVKKARRLKPDVILMDLVMPVMDGTEATERFLAERPETGILLLTTFGTADGIARSLAAGARGAMMKNVDFTELIRAIRTIATGGCAVNPEIERMIAAEPPLPELTPRQHEILKSVARGLTNADIASQLGISADVVKEHVNSLLLKIGAANRTEAVAIALRKHLIKL